MLSFEHPFIKHFYQIPMTSSTMDEAELIIKNNSIEGNFLLIAEQQSKGKGRKGNLWHSPIGGLWFTLALWNYQFPPTMMLFMGNIIRKTLLQLFSSGNFQIKWPNDVFLNKKKVCGIICNNMASQHYHIFGIGINTNNKSAYLDGNYQSTSILDSLHESVDHKQLLKLLLDNISNNISDFNHNGLNSFIDEFNKHHYLHDKRIIVTTDYSSVEGKCHGISHDGAIQIQTDDNSIIPVYAGSITLVD